MPSLHSRPTAGYVSHGSLRHPRNKNARCTPESDIVTLILDRTNLELRIEGDALAVYRFGEYRGSIPLKLLERVVLQGMIRFDADVLGALAEAGVPAVILGSCCIAVRRAQ